MSYHNSPDRDQSFEIIRQGFLEAEGLPLSDVLTADQIQHAFEEEDALFGEGEDDVYTPALTLWTLLSQVLHSGVERTCDATVERLRSLCLALGIRAPSPDSGAYCRARAKIPVKVLQGLAFEVADELERRVPEEELWCGRHVKIADGSTLLLPDTETNQEAWPQSRSQKSGLGFPILRFCVLMSLATGAVCSFAEAPYRGKQTGEPALLRAQLDRVLADEVLLGDCVFCAFFLIALVLERGADVVFHQHQRRKTDYRKGTSLGHQDHLVIWTRPPRPEWMDEETYQRMPKQLVIRELTVNVSRPGCRARQVTIVTTLTDAEKYSKEALGELYRLRWHVELDLRAIKVQMHLSDLRGQCPETVRREIWAHWLAYNLIRRSMAAAAQQHDRTVRTLSFAGALQTVNGAMSQATTAGPQELRRLVEQKLESIAYHKVGHRPNRVEPRAIKRRPKPHRLLTKPRAVARAELGGSARSAV